MPPKREKSKGNVEGVYIFSEVERAFYEQQLSDCNRKLACLRQTVNDYEIHNEKLQKAYDQLDEDMADIITYLKKTLNVNTEENAELKRKVTALEELRVIEIAELKETVDELEKNFTRMKDQLTSENKLLAGKLNTLEEFRAIKEDLMKKFERQEYAFEEQEKKYKRVIYDTEKQVIIGKNKLKKEMEDKLLQLAQDFQEASEMRIAASTHKVVLENINLNNKLDSLLIMQAKVAEQNEKFREDKTAARCAMEVAEEERDEAVSKSIMQLKNIDQLTAEFEDVSKQKALYEKNQFDTEKLRAKIQGLAKTNEKLSLKVRVLEQNLHASLDDQNKSVVETAELLRECKTFKNILKESTFAVQTALKMDHWTTLDPSREILDREIVLKRILGIINQYRDAARAESMESSISISNIYEKGDLSFEVKLAGGVKTASLISFQDKRRGTPVSFPLSSSKASIKTIQSIELLPVDEDISLPTPKESLDSFNVTSLHSSYNVESEVSEGYLTDVSKLLALSRVEMQKSSMQDLSLSQLSTRKLSGMDSKSRLGKDNQKSIISGKGVSDDIEGEQHKTMPKEDESEHVQDKGESTEDTRDTVRDTGESTNDTNVLVTVEQDDNADKK